MIFPTFESFEESSISSVHVPERGGWAPWNGLGMRAPGSSSFTGVPSLLTRGLGSDHSRHCAWASSPAEKRTRSGSCQSAAISQNSLMSAQIGRSA